MENTTVKRFLWVVPSWPFPPEDGASIARANLVQSLAQLGYSIDILLVSDTAQNLVDLPQSVINSVYTIQTPNGKKSHFKLLYYFLMSFLHPKIPVVLLRFSTKKVRLAINQILHTNSSSWDAIVYDGLHMAAHQMHHGQFKKAKLPKLVLYRAHNVESDIWFRMAEQQQNSLKKWFLHNQAKRLARFEKSLISAADGVATVSATDLLKLKKLEPEMKGRVVPISFDFTKPLAFPESSAPMQVLFLGRLDWEPNKEGLVWFLKEVWPKVVSARPNIHLIIAGSGDSTWINNYINLPNLRFLGKVAGIEPLYQESSLVLAPIFFGSGTRVKIIEACQYGRPCLSTTIGAEGIGLEDKKSYYCANDAENWIRCLNNIQPEQLQKMGQAAFEHAQKSFGHDVARDEFIKLL